MEIITDKSRIIFKGEGFTESYPFNSIYYKNNQSGNIAFYKLSSDNHLLSEKIDNITVDGTQLTNSNAEELLSKLFFLIDSSNEGGSDDDKPLIVPEWKPEPDWWDIKEIIENDVIPSGYENYQKRCILLIPDNATKTNIGGLFWINQGGICKTSDGYVGTINVVHEWDTSFDKPCSRGYSTRWIIFYNTPEALGTVLNPGNEYFGYIWAYFYEGKVAEIKFNPITESVEVRPGVEVSDPTIWGAEGPVTGIMKIDIPENVTTVTNKISSGAKKLNIIKFPPLVKTIPANMFTNANFLNYPQCDFGQVENIENYSFANNNLSEELTIPATIKSVTGSAFGNNVKLKRVFWESNANLTSSIFTNSLSLKEVTIIGSVTTISGSPFNACTSLDTVILPNTITSFGANTFYGLYALKNVNFPRNNSFVNTGNYTFSNCWSLETLVFPGNIKTIGTACCNACPMLKNVTLEEGIEVIGDLAFAACLSLTSIHIPSSVKTISTISFSGCTQLADFQINPGWTPESDLSFSSNTQLSIESINNLSNNIGATSTSRRIIFNGQYNVYPQIPDSVKAAFTSKNYTLAF